MDYTNKTWGIGIFHYPYEWHKLAATKSSVLSVACRISETFTNDPS